MKLAHAITTLERRLATTFQEYRHEHPGTHKEPSDPMFQTLGKTESGKTVYSHFDHPEHKNFDFNDHLDAAKLHAKEGEDKHHHLAEAKKHTTAAEKQILEDLDLAGE